MEPFALASHAVDLLAPYLPALAETGIHVGEEAAAHALYETIARALGRHKQHSVLREFIGNPAGRELIKRIVAEAVQHDDRFAAALTSAVSAVTSATSSVVQSGNVVFGDMAGRDIAREARTDGRRRA